MNKELAKEFLFDIDDVFRKYDITFWLDCGTLLGAVRNEDFIDWDDDLDISVYKSIFLDFNLWKKVIADLMERQIYIRTAWGDSVFTCTKDTDRGMLHMDVHTYTKVGNEYQCAMSDNLFHFPAGLFDKLSIIDFKGRRFNVPYNKEKYLAMFYGDNWRTPHPEIKGWTSKQITPLFHYNVATYTRNIPLFKKINTDKKVSLIIGSYCRPELLDLDLWSISQQHISHNLEIIVCNDGIEDDTAHVCDKYRKQLKMRYIFTGQRNVNGMKYRIAGFALNIGVKQAKGDIIILSCAEIFHLNNSIDLLIDPLLTNKKILSTPTILHMDDDGECLRYLKSNQTRSIPTDLLTKMSTHKESKVATTMPFFMGMYKDEYINIGGYDEDFTGYAADDNDIMFRLLCSTNDHEGLKYHYTQSQIIHLYHGKKSSSGQKYDDPAWVYNYNLFLDRKEKKIVNRNVGREWGKL